MHAVVSKDGMIARNSHESTTTWTSAEDLEHFRKKMNESDVVVVGHNTYDVAEVYLSKRNCILVTSRVKRFLRTDNKLLLWNPKGVPPEKILADYKKIAVIGGTRVYTYFLDNDLIDEIYITTEPITFGEGVPLFSHPVDLSARFAWEGARTLNPEGSIRCHYVRS